jgi:chromosome segregation ATPase
MKALAAATFLACTWPCAVWPQAQSVPAQSGPGQETPATAAPPTAPSEVETDRWGPLKSEVEHLQQVWDRAHTENMAQVEKLLHSNVCQSTRVGRLLDRTQSAMNDYLNTFKKYWDVWSNAENKRVDDQRKQLASMVVNQDRAKAMLEDEKKNREDLDRREAALDQGTRTEAVKTEIEQVKKEIIDSEANLNDANQKFESLTFQVTNMNTTIMARVISINQAAARLEAWGLKQTSVYDDKRKEANAVCDTYRPGALRTPPQKGTANP